MTTLKLALWYIKTKSYTKFELNMSKHVGEKCGKLHICKSLKLTRAPRGTDRSPEYNEHFCYKLDSRVKNLTTEWNQKQQHFITHAPRSLL